MVLFKSQKFVPSVTFMIISVPISVPFTFALIVTVPLSDGVKVTFSPNLMVSLLRLPLDALKVKLTEYRSSLS